MIPYLDALRLLRAEVRPLSGEEVPLEEAPGRFSSGDLPSPTSLPPFPNSAMDGFALLAGEAGLPAGTALQVVGRVAAGDGPPGEAPEERLGDGSRGDGKAWEIMTGAPVPSGLDSVVPVERVDAREEGGRVTSIRLLDDEEAGRNIRPAGADFVPGDPVLAPGRRIGAVEVMALAALGVGRVPVLEVPGAAILSTGPELVDDPQLPLPPGGIRNSNGPFLARALETEGVRVLSRRTLGDDEAPFRRAVEEAVEAGARLVISTGAVSMGRYDFVPEALERLGARILFHRAAIRPGKPILAAVLPGGAIHFGLPGNPISAAVGFRFFVHPLLRALRGLGPERGWTMPLGETRRKPLPFRQFLKARVETTASGSPRVDVLPGQESFRIAPMLRTHAWAVLPEGVGEVEEGEMVEVFGMDGPILPD
jgi:molybdopterin molybdotransferase